MSLESFTEGEPGSADGGPRRESAQRRDGGQRGDGGQRRDRSQRRESALRRGQRMRLLDDPVVIRALAHPLRLELLSIAGQAGQITTADAARKLGISHGLTSHHLRQLAKYGFVRQVEGKDHRERPWRLATTSATWRGADATPERAAAANVLEQVLAERALAQFLGWQQRRIDWPEAWRNHTGIGQSTIYLTLPELVELVAAVESLIQRYVDERPLDDVAARPPGSVPVDITQFAVPLSGPPGDG